MQIKNTQAYQIQKERREISKYVGSVLARSFLLFLLFITTPFLAPVSAYFFLFFLLFPCILSNIFSSRSPETTLLLASCAKKFHFTKARYQAENLTRNFIIFSLVLWQTTSDQSTQHLLLQFAPGLFLLSHLLCKTISTIVIRQKIHHYYMNFLYK